MKATETAVVGRQKELAPLSLVKPFSLDRGLDGRMILTPRKEELHKVTPFRSAGGRNSAVPRSDHVKSIVNCPPMAKALLKVLYS